MSKFIYSKPEVIIWSQILLDSFATLLGYELCNRNISKLEQSEALFKANFVVVSHGVQDDPILNYGNQLALKLWEMDWLEFTYTPSRLTAEPINREAREVMLQQVKAKGYIDNYSGIRISKTGKRFLIKEVIIWNLFDNEGNKKGQAAIFYKWVDCE